MRKILINVGAGGFSFSDEAEDAYFNLHGCFPREVTRDDHDLIDFVEQRGFKSVEGKYCTLKIVEIPEDVLWGIGADDYGFEWVYEQHRRWC